MWVQIIDDAISNLVTTLYTGTGAARSIVTGQNNAAGSLVWIKDRSATRSHQLFDTERGSDYALFSDSSVSQFFHGASCLSSFNSNGFSLGTGAEVNASGNNFVAWSFLQKAGFLDIVELNSVGAAATRLINHGLGVEPALIIGKVTDASGNFYTYHTSLGNTKALILDSTDSAFTDAAYWNNTSPSSTQFTTGTAFGNSGSYIFYLFAHNPAQKIFCGSFTTDGSGNATVTGLGFRPKWLLAKTTNGTSGWIILDTERGWGAGNDAQLRANVSDAEIPSGADYGAPTSDGFTWAISASTTYIFMAVG